MGMETFQECNIFSFPQLFYFQITSGRSSGFAIFFSITFELYFSDINKSPRAYSSDAIFNDLAEDKMLSFIFKLCSELIPWSIHRSPSND